MPMLIKIKNKTFDSLDSLLDSRYGTDVVVALVGDNAAHQFRQTSLSMEEIEVTMPFTCVDTRYTEQELQNIIRAIKDSHMLLCPSDTLFVLSELETEKDLDNCLKFSEQLKSYNLSFLVTHEKNRHKVEFPNIASKFKHTIFVTDDTVNLFYPVKHLICDYYRPSCVGIDVADVFYVFMTECKMTSYFLRKTFPHMDAMKDYVPELLADIDAKIKVEHSYPNFMFFIEVSQSMALDEIDNFTSSVIDKYADYDTNIVWSFNFNREESDDTCTLLLQTVFPSQENE